MGRSSVRQTGSTILSDTTIQRKQEQNRTVRFQYRQVAGCYQAFVTGPSTHSALYGLCGSGITKQGAFDQLRKRLANDHSFFGRMVLSGEK